MIVYYQIWYKIIHLCSVHVRGWSSFCTIYYCFVSISNFGKFTISHCFSGHFLLVLVSRFLAYIMFWKYYILQPFSSENLNSLSLSDCNYLFLCSCYFINTLQLFIYSWNVFRIITGFNHFLLAEDIVALVILNSISVPHTCYFSLNRLFYSLRAAYIFGVNMVEVINSVSVHALQENKPISIIIIKKTWNWYLFVYNFAKIQKCHWTN